MKNYSCNVCKGVSRADEWNESTRDRYGEDIYQIDDDKRYGQSCYFVCPKCQSDCDDDVISEIGGTADGR